MSAQYQKGSRESAALYYHVISMRLAITNNSISENMVSDKHLNKPWWHTFLWVAHQLNNVYRTLIQITKNDIQVYFAIKPKESKSITAINGGSLSGCSCVIKISYCEMQ